MESRVKEQKKFLMDTACLAVFLGMGWLLFRHVLRCFFPFLAGYFIAYLIRPAVCWCSRATGIGYRGAGYLVLIGAYLILAIGLVRCSAALLTWLQELAAGLPSFYREVLRPSARQLEALLQQLIPASLSGLWSLEQVLDQLQGRTLDFSAEAIAVIGGVTAKLPTYVMSLLFTIMCSLFISANYEEITAFLLRQVPGRYRELARSAKTGAGAAVLSYLRACLILQAATFGQLVVGLWLLGVERFFLTAAAIALLDFIPAVGMSLVMVPWAGLSLLQGRHAFAVGLLLVNGVAFIVHNILEPKLAGIQMGVNPVVSLCAIYLGYRTLGVTGMVLVPIIVQLAVGLHRSGVVRLWK